jgi:hypothetical protein
MPTPEQLGLITTPASEPGANWSEASQRLKKLGASCFQMERLQQGGYRFVCLLPTAQPGRTHRVEAEAASEADAVRLALGRAEQWASAR